MPHSETSDIPRLVRRLLEEAKTNESESRKAEKLRLRFLVGGELQWEEDEKAARKSKGRPFITINECEPPVNKVVNGVENNPPGPACAPVGGGADGDTADIISGMIRQIEYDSMAKVTYTAQTRYVTASGRGVLEWGTDWASDHDCSQKIVIKESEDPALYYCDPAARGFARQDAMWRIKLKSLSRDAYQALYGTDREVLRTSRWKQMAGSVANVIGMPNELTSIHEWTGGGSGPFFVAEFWQRKPVTKTLALYDNLNFYLDGEAPEGLEKIRRNDAEGQIVSREVTTYTVTKYVVDACEELSKAEFIIDEIPIIDILGPEIYIDGKLHRLSLIHNMIDPQRALNFTSSAAVEVSGLVPLSPMIGAEGQFLDEKWATMNTEVHAYLEYTPVLMANDAEPAASQWAPPPQRNMWNAAIEWLLNLAGFQKQSLQETSQTYDESLGKNRGDQSGEAVKALQVQSQMGNSHYVAALRTGIEVMYGQIQKAMTLVYDGARAVTIIGADSQHEIALINQDFAHPDGGTDEQGKPKTKRNDITIGQYSVRCTTGPDELTRDSSAIENITGFFKAVPAALQAPGVAAAYLRLVGQGNPKVEQMADLMSPDQGDGEMKPEQMKAALAQTKQQLQQVTQAAQQMSQKIQAGLPKIEADKFKAVMDNLTKIRVAEITASKDLDRANADREADALTQLLGMAHDAGQQAQEHSHQVSQAQSAQAAQSAQSSQDAAQSAQTPDGAQ